MAIATPSLPPFPLPPPLPSNDPDQIQNGGNTHALDTSINSNMYFASGNTLLINFIIGITAVAYLARISFLVSYEYFNTSNSYTCQQTCLSVTLEQANVIHSLFIKSHSRLMDIHSQVGAEVFTCGNQRLSV